MSEKNKRRRPDRKFCVLVLAKSQMRLVVSNEEAQRILNRMRGLGIQRVGVN